MREKELLNSLSLGSRLVNSPLPCALCKVTPENRALLESELLSLGAEEQYNLELEDDSLKDALKLILKKLDSIQRALSSQIQLESSLNIARLGHYALFLKEGALELGGQYYLRFELGLDRITPISMFGIAIDHSALRISKCSNQNALDAYIAKRELAEIIETKRSERE